MFGRAFKPPYTFHKRQLLHGSVQEQWKFKSMTDRWTNRPMDGLTWVDARDNCMYNKAVGLGQLDEII